MSQQNVQFTATTGGAGDTTIVAAVAGQRIRVIGFLLTSTAALAARFYSAASPTNPITGPLSLAVNGSLIVPPFSRPGGPGSAEYWFMTNPGEALVLNNSAAGTVAGVAVVDIY